MLTIEAEREVHGDRMTIEPRVKSDHAYDMLVDRIIHLDYMPGEQLPEKRLMDELQIGRTPVREALQRLAVEGLVCRERHRGIYVCEVDAHSVEELFEYRLATEGMIARLAASRIKKDRLAVLRALHKMADEEIVTGKCQSYTLHARALYVSMAAASGNLHFQEAAPRVFNLDARLTVIASRAPDDWCHFARGSSTAMGELLDCFENQLADEAEHLAKLYVVRRYREFLARF